MEALQGAELTGTNRPCGLAISSKASIEFDARSSGDDEVTMALVMCPVGPSTALA